MQKEKMDMVRDLNVVEDRFPFLIMSFCNITYLVSTVLFLIFEGLHL